MEDLTRLRHQWIADHILQWEAEVRRWLGRYTRTLRADDIDDLIQEAYARLWSADFTRIRDGRTFLYSVVRNVLQDQLRRARVVQIECVAEIDAQRNRRLETRLIGTRSCLVEVGCIRLRSKGWGKGEGHTPSIWDCAIHPVRLPVRMP